MSWEFKPGMKVVCIVTSKKRPEYDEIQTEVNKIYTIRDIRPCPSGSEVIGLLLEEIVNKPQHYLRHFGECLYSKNIFRPLQTQFTSLLNSIVAGVNGGRLVVEDDKYMKKFKKSQRKETVR